MSILVTCPGCSFRMNVADELADTLVKCRACSMMVRVPPPMTAEEQAALERYQNKVNAELFGDVNLASHEQLPAIGAKPTKVRVARCNKCRHAIDPELDVCPICGHNQLAGLHAPVHAARKFRRSLGTDIGSLRSDVRSSLRTTMIDFQGVSTRKLFVLSAVAVLLGLGPLLGVAFPALAGPAQFLPFIGLFIGLSGGVVYYFTGDTRAAFLGLSGTVGAVSLSVMLILPKLVPPPQDALQKEIEAARMTQPASTAPAAPAGMRTVELR